ncbi:hypothetical protein DV532_26615 (plasmid) [Pseudomonas sp. Leaf58]|uniref:hypothetical protein n=1 Tax=Pseudomonas sp. Leaf58 TaxID=1736226 RepID=UPI0006FD5999|nr:hypothetical protein [Pseudomonas sp. Leaf58]AYG47860.1 hypothetical protein DV532_26615 [Pseudomonas sp. Leaf58]KQN62575.1 hypothetical protein ASF02_10540 [Pseudomonas sp. Leaf58]
MRTQANEEVLRQSYIRRVLDFWQLYVANQQSQDHSSTAAHAILLACDLLDDYVHIGNIAATFQPELRNDDFQNGVFGAFTNALAIEHDRLDQLLEQVHLDYNGHYPAQLLATNPARTAMMTYYPTRAMIGDQLKPQLWDSQGNLLHNSVHFITTRKASVDSQLYKFYQENGPAILNVINMLPTLDASIADIIVSSLKSSFSIDHVAVNDPRRLAMASYLDVSDEFNDRLKMIMMGLKHERRVHGSAIDRLFDIFQFLNAQEKQHALETFEADLSVSLEMKDDCVDYNSAVHAYSVLLSTACQNGFDADKFFAKHFEAKTHRNHDVFAKVAAALPAKRADAYVGEPVCAVLCAAFLLNKDDDVLLASDLNGDALLSLYILKGDERYKDALRTPEKADLLLANELGL